MGHAVAVWERNKASQSAASQLNQAYTQGFEIAYAVWDGSRWSAPGYLTNNAVLDHSPVLAQGRNGKLMLVWQENAAGELAGSSGAPDTVYTAIWDGGHWSEPQSVPIAESRGLSLAYLDTHTLY